MQFLMDDGDAGGLALARRLEDSRDAVHPEAAAVRRVVAREDLEQRGLARAVFAHEGADFAARDGKRNVLQSHHGRKDLADGGVLEQRRHAASSRSSGRKLSPVIMNPLVDVTGGGPTPRTIHSYIVEVVS